jgi:type I site-specific restriction endonuclease
MRPIFSPTDFIQIKGRGTRKHNFTEEVVDAQMKEQLGEKQKTILKYSISSPTANTLKKSSIMTKS